MDRVGQLGGFGLLLLRELGVKLEGGTGTPGSTVTHQPSFACDASCSPLGVTLSPLTTVYQATVPGCRGRQRPTRQMACGQVHRPDPGGDPDIPAHSPRALCPCGFPDLVLASIRVSVRDRGQAGCGYSFHHQDPTDQDLTQSPSSHHGGLPLAPQQDLGS